MSANGSTAADGGLQRRRRGPLDRGCPGAFLLQRLHEGSGIRIAACGVLPEARDDDLFEARRNVRLNRRRTRDFVVEYLDEHRVATVGLERPAAGCHLEQRAAERPQVARRAGNSN
jgi:hypothetical protein